MASVLAGELGAFPPGGIPGLTLVGAAVILAEAGDPRRHETSSSLVKHAGQSPADTASGAFEGASRISRRGPPRLRTAAWRMVFPLLLHNPVMAAKYKALASAAEPAAAESAARARPGSARAAQTVYYTPGTNPLVAACGNEPEWANLTCQTGPAAQPGTTGLPDLPVTTYTYDDSLNAVAKTETYGTTGTRSTTGYDTAERPVTDTQTLNPFGTVTADINTTYDDFGQMLTYTDASGNTTTYTYDIAGRVTSRADGEGSQTISYSGSYLAPSQITDSQAGTFTASWNPDGNLATETYPGGVTASYTYDSTGTATSVSYDGTSWSAPLTDTVVPDAAGDWATEAITDTAIPLTSTKAYTYDNDDRITSVEDTQDGQCTTRAYAYDADSNRTSLASYAPNSDGTCQAGTGTTTTESYDSADRATNSGYAYDTQGDITTTPIGRRRRHRHLRCPEPSGQSVH